MRVRLDQLLVNRGLAESREKAKALIIAGQVLVNGQKGEKPGSTVAENIKLELTARMPYVSRGGYKLAHALDHFHIAVENLLCLDVGASTGGFTDCLLQRGAARVFAMDVGHGQFDWKLRNHPRVEVRENFNARHMTAADFPAPFDLAVCDASFISVTLLVPAIAATLTERGEMVVLVKPQFEVGKGEVGKGGVVRDPALHEASCLKVRSAVEALGFLTDLTESPILGAEGNKEFLLHGRRS